MKKIKIMFCVLVVGLSALSYLIVTKKSVATELFILNVEALSLDESTNTECSYITGTCWTSEGVIFGMALAD